MEESAPRSRGRPRNEETLPAVLAVVRQLVVDRGYQAVSVNLIAEQAGVAKQTLYRRWPSKAEIVLDAFLESASRFDEVPYEGLVPTLTRLLGGLFVHLKQDGPAIRSLIASAQSDVEFEAQLRSRFVEPRAAVIAQVLQMAVNSGELPVSTDVDVLCDMIHGAFWYRLLNGQTLDAAYAKALARHVKAS